MNNKLMKIKAKLAYIFGKNSSVARKPTKAQGPYSHDFITNVFQSKFNITTCNIA